MSLKGCSKTQKGISYLCMLLVISCMLGAAELLGQREIIFPEMAAIGLGIFVSPNRSWATNKKRMLILITIAAALGVLIVRFVPLGKWGQMLLAYGISQIILIYSRTTFAPFISALVLPVMLGEGSIVYFLSAVILTAAVLGITQLLEIAKIWDKGPFEQRQFPDYTDWGNAGIRVVIVGILLWLALRFDCMYAVAPPILVAFTEFVRPGGQPVKKPFRIIFLITVCAGLGSFCRYVFCIWFRGSLVTAGLVTTVLVILIVLRMKMFIPPAAALAILPMLIPVEKVLIYPLHILIGICVYVLISIWITKKDLFVKKK